MRLKPGTKIAICIAAAAVAAGGVTAALMLRHTGRQRPITIVGAVISQSPQAEKESPIAGADITGRIGMLSASCKSDASGFFKLVLPPYREPGVPITLRFLRTGYQPMVLPVVGGAGPYVIRMVPTAPQPARLSSGPPVAVSNISVRYSAKTSSAVNVGSTVKTFQVENEGGEPCNHRRPCSPDGKWKAAEATISLDAGQGNVFRNARVSCIAGPCPFTAVAPEKIPNQERVLKITAYDWSETATFLVEAEVYHPLQNAGVHRSYPVIFGRVLDFTLPASAEGVCIEADLHGEHIIYPLGPDPDLSWASCSMTDGQNRTKAYRCELKEGYRFNQK
ncbi:MAG TPA: carboxypeptidase regulatory-like domain-containing protein [Terriglobia bacterium]|nr:carboxypeptidase regulatory-like domain-containing protein [Terriglobia bacterium]